MDFNKWLKQKSNENVSYPVTLLDTFDISPIQAAITVDNWIMGKSDDWFVENILMVYKYCENRNFEDLASGKVIVHRAGYPNFPVRLAQEIFCRCLHHLDDPDSVCIYDPCCGGGYLLTVLGFLNFERIKTIIASDISDDAIQLANENLLLLDQNGLQKRIRQINDLLSLHNKNSHIEALNSATNYSI